MLSTQRHDRRSRRQVRFRLESLDDRLVLSAGAGGAAAEAVVHHPVADDAHLPRRPDVLGHGRPLRCGTTCPRHSSRSTASTRTRAAAAVSPPACWAAGRSRSAAPGSTCSSRSPSPPPSTRSSPVSGRTGYTSSGPCRTTVWPKACCRSPRCRPRSNSRRTCGRLPRRARDNSIATRTDGPGSAFISGGRPVHDRRAPIGRSPCRSRCRSSISPPGDPSLCAFGRIDEWR